MDRRYVYMLVAVETTAPEPEKLKRALVEAVREVTLDEYLAFAFAERSGEEVSGLALSEFERW